MEVTENPDDGFKYVFLENGNKVQGLQKFHEAVEAMSTTLDKIIPKIKNKAELNIIFNIKETYDAYLENPIKSSLYKFFIINRYGDVRSILPILHPRERIIDIQRLAACIIFTGDRYFGIKTPIEYIRKSVYIELDRFVNNFNRLDENWERIGPSEFEKLYESHQADDLISINDQNQELEHLKQQLLQTMEIQSKDHSEFQKALESLSKTQDEFGKLLTNFKSRASKTISESNRQVENFEATAQEALGRFEDIEKRAAEFAKYEQLDKYFSIKASENIGKAKNWLIRFNVFLAVGVVTVFVCLYALTDKLPVLKTGEYELGKALFIALPVIAGIWVLRICMKFSTHHMRLHEDAENKKVLLRTLAALEADKPDFSEQAQLVAYNAIFRASLSDGSDLDVAQPSLGDIAGLIKGKKG